MDKTLEAEQTANSSLLCDLPVGDKSCLESSTPVKKLQIHEKQHLNANFVSPTPEKTDETVNMKYKKEPTKLPEKYQLLSEFFDRMTTSLRLLNLHKKLPIFHNISRQVEALTGRKFSYKNLAQIKFILPEAVEIDRILLHNKKTFCMEADIKVTLLFDIIEGHIEHSDYIALSRLFSSRLFKFITTHSQECDVPEAELPEPFNKKEMKDLTYSIPANSPTKTVPEIKESNPSHLPPSFNTHFSKKNFEKSTKTELLSSHSLESDSIIDKETELNSNSDQFEQKKDIMQIGNEDTPMKNQLISGEISIETPDLSTPKRLMSTEVNKINQKATGSSFFAKRVLDFSNEAGFLEDSDTDSSAKVDDDVIITQSGVKTHEPTSDSLSDIVETIYNIFHSANCYSMTKSQLVHKILVNNFDITENGEAEEQIELVVKTVPDWISKKADPTGDFMYTMNKWLDLKSIIEKLT